MRAGRSDGFFVPLGFLVVLFAVESSQACEHGRDQPSNFLAGQTIMDHGGNALPEDIRRLCDLVRETSYAIHEYHAHGHVETVYENALMNRLRKLGLMVEQQRPICVYDEDGTLIGDFKADILVENKLILELKAVKTLLSEHEAQLFGYLKSARLEHGLLINFGSFKFEIRKYVWNGRR